MSLGTFFNPIKGRTKQENRFNFTPYDVNVDQALTYLDDYETFMPYRQALVTVEEYIEHLEDIIYGYTE